MRTTIRILTAALLSQGPAALAEIPSPYNPIPVEAPFSFSERRFDLTEAFDRAKREKKPLLVYLGAKNCPYCKEYEHLLGRKQEALLPIYSKLVVVDIRTWLTGPDLYFQVGGARYSFADFNARYGDGAKKVVYPYYWLLTPELKPVRVPQGSQFYRDLEAHKKLLASKVKAA